MTHSQDGQGGIASDADATRAVTALYQEHALGLTRLAFVPLGSEPPVSVLTALLGGPFFLFLLWRGRGLRAEL